MSPSKRKFRSNSADSMATNVALLGDSDRESPENPFADPDSYDMLDMEPTEVTDLRSLTPLSSKTLRDSVQPGISHEVESPILGKAAGALLGSTDPDGAPVADDAGNVEMVEKSGVTPLAAMRASAGIGRHRSMSLDLDHIPEQAA